MRTFQLAAALFAVPAIAWAQPDPSPDGIVDGFFRGLQAGEVTKAYQGVWAGTQMLANKPADVAMMASQTSSALQLYGRIYGWEPVKEDVVAPSYRVQTHMLRTDLAPLFFRFQFYRKQDKWTVYRLDFADQMSRLP